MCQLCGKSGHVALKCFKRLDVTFTGVSSSQPQAFYTDMNGYGYGYSQDDGYVDEENFGQWFVDSGSTNHVTNDVHNLSIRSTYTGDEHLVVGNGSQLPIDCIGKSVISNLSRSHILSNILYVPQITKNLISISQFTRDNGVFVEFHDNACFVKDRRSCKILMKGMLERGLYQLDLSTFPMQPTSGHMAVFTRNKVLSCESVLNCDVSVIDDMKKSEFVIS